MPECCQDSVIIVFISYWFSLRNDNSEALVFQASKRVGTFVFL